jgi:hypothetical protein
MQSTPHSRKILALFLLSGLLSLFLLTAAPKAQARPSTQDEVTPTLEPGEGGTPAWLLTPFPTPDAAETSSRPGALLATAVLLMCGMVVMLAGGIGIAVIMVRLRNRRSP